MPVVHKSTIKRARQAEKRNEANRAAHHALKSVMRRVAEAIDQKNADHARAALRDATSALSRAVSKGLLKRNTASRRIARMAHRINALASAKR